MPSGLCVCELEQFIKTSLKFYSAGLVSEGLGYNPLRAGQPKQLHSGALAVVPRPHGKRSGRRCLRGGRDGSVRGAQPGAARAEGPAGGVAGWTRSPRAPSTVMARGKGMTPLFVCGEDGWVRDRRRPVRAQPRCPSVAAGAEGRPAAPCADRDAVPDGGRRFPPRPTWRRWLPVTCPWGGARPGPAGRGGAAIA